MFEQIDRKKALLDSKAHYQNILQKVYVRN